MVFGDGGPAVTENFHVAFADIDHGFNRENHAGFDGSSFAALAEMHDMGFFVKVFADAVAAEFSDHRIAVAFGVLLDGMANVAEMRAGFDLLYAEKKTLPGDFHQSFGVRTDVADAEHLAGVTVVAILDDGDVDIDDVAVF